MPLSAAVSSLRKTSRSRQRIRIPLLIEVVLRSCQSLSIIDEQEDGSAKSRWCALNVRTLPINSRQGSGCRITLNIAVRQRLAMRP